MTLFCFFFFSSRRRHTRCYRDWSSDVCSSDLAGTVDVFDSKFNPVLKTGAFLDSEIPEGYAPFGIQAIGSRIYVTYRSEERRVGKECRSRWSRDQDKKKETKIYQW